MSEPQLTEAMIRSLATSQSFSRGQDYYYSGAVWSLERRGNTFAVLPSIRPPFVARRTPS